MMTAATLLISTANTTKAAGDEVVGFTIIKDQKSYTDTLGADNSKEDLTGKTVIISTNDIHGAIKDLAYVAGLKNKMEERGAVVCLVDSGDFSTDKSDVKNYDKKKSKEAGFATDESDGIAAVKIMNAVDYDFACLGNHEFEHGKDVLDGIINAADFTFVDANIDDFDYEKVQKSATVTVDPEGADLTIGLFGLLTPENNGWYGKYGYHVDSNKLHETASETANYLDGQGADVIIALAHLGVDNQVLKDQTDFVFDRDEDGHKIYDKVYANGTRSVDLFAFTGEDDGVHKIDLILDGHSHTTMSGIDQEKYPGCNIQSQGIQLQNIGVTVIDNSSKTITDRYLISEDSYSQFGKDPMIEAYINTVIKAVQDGETIPDYNPEDYAEYASTTDADEATTGTTDDASADADVTEDSSIDTTDDSSEDTSVDITDDSSDDSSDNTTDGSSDDSSDDSTNSHGHGHNHHNSHHRYGRRAA